MPNGRNERTQTLDAPTPGLGSATDVVWMEIRDGCGRSESPLASEGAIAVAKGHILP